MQSYARRAVCTSAKGFDACPGSSATRLAALAISNVKFQSAIAERAASTAGNIDTKKISKMSATSFEMLSFLADNTLFVGDPSKVRSVTYNRAKKILKQGCISVRATPLTEVELEDLQQERSALNANFTAFFADEPEQTQEPSEEKEEESAALASDEFCDSSEEVEDMESPIVQRVHKADIVFKKRGILGVYESLLGDEDDITDEIIDPD